MKKAKFLTLLLTLSTVFLVLLGLSVAVLAAPPNIKEFQITKNAVPSGEPSVSRNIVVWTDNRNGDFDIYGVDLSKPLPKREFPIVVRSGDQLRTDVSGEIVVWQDNSVKPTRIFAKNLSTGQEFVVSPGPANQVQPAISGNIVVWNDYRNEGGTCCNGDIFGYNLATGTEFPISTSLSHQVFPDIGDNKVVWLDNRNTIDPFYPKWDVYSYDLTTDIEARLTTESFNQGFAPKVSREAAVWATGGSLYIYEFATQSLSIIAVGSAEYPNVSGNIVVWRDRRNFGTTKGDIYAYDMTTKEEFVVSDRSSDQNAPSVDKTVFGTEVVWQDVGSIFTEIWGAVLQ